MKTTSGRTTLTLKDIDHSALQDKLERLACLLKEARTLIDELTSVSVDLTFEATSSQE